MTQQTIQIDNKTFPNVRTDLNLNLKALSTNQAGAVAPTGALGYSWWFNWTDETLNMNNGAEDEFIPMGYFNQTLNSFDIMDGTYISSPGPTRTNGQLTTTSQDEWTAGTSATETLISPAKLKATIGGGGGGGGGSGGGGAAAWINFNGATATINGHHNIGSFGRAPGSNVGGYALTFITPLKVSSYAAIASASNGSGSYGAYFASAGVIKQTTLGCTIITGSYNIPVNAATVSVAFFDTV